MSSVLGERGWHSGDRGLVVEMRIVVVIAAVGERVDSGGEAVDVAVAAGFEMDFVVAAAAVVAIAAASVATMERGR